MKRIFSNFKLVHNQLKVLNINRFYSLKIILFQGFEI